MRKCRMIVVLILSALIFVSCSKNSSSGVTQDREGNSITLPSKIDTVISIGAANTEILTALGLADKLIAVDDYSLDVEGLPGGITAFDMYAIDVEMLISLEPDVIFASSMMKIGNVDPLEQVSATGIPVVYIPVSESIEEIKNDITFLAESTNTTSKGTELIENMETEIDKIRSIGQSITDKKTVYFEISAAPYLYSFGSGVFLDEILELIGAVNVFSGEQGWIPLSEEVLLDANPDVILTNVNYVPNPTEEIVSRDGWDALTAVQDGAVYYIDTNSSSRSTHNIIKALNEMAKAIYPDMY